MAQMLKKSACNGGDWGLTPGSERSPGEGNGFFLFSFSTTVILKVQTLNQHNSTTWNWLEMQIIGLTSQLQNQRLGDGD